MSTALEAPRSKLNICVPLASGGGEATRCLFFPLLKEERFQGSRRDAAYGIRLPDYGFFDTDEAPLITGVASWSPRAEDTWFAWVGSNPGQPVRPNPTRFFSRTQRIRSHLVGLSAFLPLVVGGVAAVLFYTRVLPWQPAQAPPWTIFVICAGLMAAGIGAVAFASSVHCLRSRAVWANLPNLPPLIAALVKQHRKNFTKMYVVAEMRGRWLITETRNQIQFKGVDREAVIAEEPKRERRLAPALYDDVPVEPEGPRKAMLVGAMHDEDFGTEKLCLIRKFEL